MANSVNSSVVNEVLGEGGFPFRDVLSKQVGNIIAKEVPEVRERVYTPEVTFFGMIYGALDPNSSLRKTVIRNNADRISRGLEPASINTAAFSKARDRLPTEVLKQAAKLVAVGAQPEVPEEWKWHGMEVKALDGSTVTADDTQENQKAFPQHGNQKEGVGFPLIRLVILQSITTGMIHDLSFGAYKGKTTGEMALARNIMDSLTPNSLLLGDRYYPSYFFICELFKRGVEFLFQSHAAREIDFRQGKSLGHFDHIVSWERPQRPSWMTKEEYNLFPSSIDLREVDITEQVGSQERFVVVTTLLDNEEYNKKELSDLYLKRWGIELALRNLKDTMGMEHLSVQSPKMVEKILWSYVMAFNGIRWYMANAAALGSRKPESISFKTTHDILEANKSNILNTRGVKHRKLLSEIFCQILNVKVGQRGGRIEPRVVKKRPKSYKRMTQSRGEWRSSIQNA